jgi:hypothetical protein
VSFYWEVDSNRKRHNEPLGDYDYLFIAGKEFEDYPDGIFLPMAADPDIHMRIGEPVVDLCTVGAFGDSDAFAGYGERKRLFELAEKKGFSTYQTCNVYLEDYSKALSKGNLILNRAGLTDLNMKFFEYMAVGCMLWWDLGIYKELATPDYHYVSFNTDKEFLFKLEKYTKDKKARDEIAKNARNLILAKNTYQHRVREILSYV